jgi:hypothetical protein
MTRSDSEWDQRILCSDGNCIGIIGADGRCKTCGLPYDGQQPLPVADSDETDDTVNELPEAELTIGIGRSHRRRPCSRGGFIG